MRFRIVFRVQPRETPNTKDKVEVKMDTSQPAAIHLARLVSRYVALLQGVYFLVSGI